MLNIAYLIGPVGFAPSVSVFALVSSRVCWPGAGDGPVFELELLFRGFIGDFRLPESLLSLDRTEAALLEVLEPGGLSFSCWDSSRCSSDSTAGFGFSSRGAFLYTCRKKLKFL